MYNDIFGIYFGGFFPRYSMQYLSYFSYEKLSRDTSLDLCQYFKSVILSFRSIQFLSKNKRTSGQNAGYSFRKSLTFDSFFNELLKNTNSNCMDKNERGVTPCIYRWCKPVAVFGFFAHFDPFPFQCTDRSNYAIEFFKTGSGSSPCFLRILLTTFIEFLLVLNEI